ncbi:ABC-2 type transport system permease protein [Neobacillus bataviensis]|uniref:Transport permease protein n=1 Tax=Neobacillus bataviensis TaxID=220685 RepID=A0A561D5Q0_9BACI|nr:ABC transporter permease [Neobacillus bataviensis]TWD98674.1 ABC-2 type transport system permease protein [Neobacillus bataviensis]
MKEIMWLVANSLRSIFLNKRRIFAYVLVPLLGIFISFMAYGNTGPTFINTGIVDLDQTTISQNTSRFISGLNNVKTSKLAESEVKNKIASGALDCAIILEPGFSQAIMDGEKPEVQIVSVKGAQVTTYIKAYLNNYIGNLSSLSTAANGDNTVFNTLYQNYQNSEFKVSTHSLKDTSNNNDMTIQTIGFLLMIMLNSAGGLSELILKEKENRTYFRIMSAPIDGKKYVLSNVIVNMIIMTIQVVVTLTVMTKVFGISAGVPFWEMIGVMMFFSLVSVGLSLVITAFATNSNSAGALQNLIMTPTCLLAGCFWPVEIMPKAAQKIADFLPQRWLLDTISELQKGHTLSSLSLNLVTLLAFALVFFMIAIYKFSRSNNVRSFI